jgi:hypothetical protein
MASWFRYFLLLCCSFSCLTHISQAHSFPTPNALLLPFTKDATTLQYVTKITGHPQSHRKWLQSNSFTYIAIKKEPELEEEEQRTATMWSGFGRRRRTDEEKKERRRRKEISCVEDVRGEIFFFFFNDYNKACE